MPQFLWANPKACNIFRLLPCAFRTFLDTNILQIFLTYSYFTAALSFIFIFHGNTVTFFKYTYWVPLCNLTTLLEKNIYIFNGLWLSINRMSHINRCGLGHHHKQACCYLWLPMQRNWLVYECPLYALFYLSTESLWPLQNLTQWAKLKNTWTQ